MQVINDCFLGHRDGIYTKQSKLGMFVWIKISGIPDSASLISSKAVEKRVLLVPGFEFYPNPRKTPYVRAAYSIASEADIETGLERLAELIKEAQTEMV